MLLYNDRELSVLQLPVMLSFLGLCFEVMTLSVVLIFLICVIGLPGS